MEQINSLNAVRPAEGAEGGVMGHTEIPVELFCDYAVYCELSERAKARTSHENVSDTLGALVRLLHKTGKTPTQAPTDEAEFELHAQDGICVASASGPHEEAWQEIQHYAMQYIEEGPVSIYEVTRRLIRTIGLPGMSNDQGETQ